MSCKVLLVDHKSTGRLDSKQAKFYGVSGQLLNYKWIGSMVYGEKFGGVMLNMVQHTPPKFERPRLDPAPALFARFPQIVEDAERRIAELEDEGRAPGEWPACPTELTCFHRYGPCDHLERCKWGA